MANRIINNCHEIEKGFMSKSVAEKQYGFSLYQGGIVPGNELRVVNIKGVDVEACCGTHGDNTAEVGWVRIISSQRKSDGIVRLTYVAQERAIEVLGKEAGILSNLCEAYGVDLSQLEKTSDKFYQGWKSFKKQVEDKDQQILSLQIRCMLRDT